MTRSHLLLFGFPVLAVGAAAGIAWALMDRAGPDEQFRAGLAALERGDLDAARASLLALDEAPARHGPQARVLRAALFAHYGQYARALYELRDVQLEGEGDAWVSAIATEAIERLGPIPAAAFLQMVAEEEPQLPNVHRWLAIVYYDLGAMVLALEHLEELVRLAPEDYRPHRLIGLIYHDLDQHEPAISAYLAALRLDPPANVREEILIELAQSRVKQRDYEGALESLERLAASAYVLALEAECHRNLGNVQRARALLAEARQREPEQREVLLLTARMALDAGDPAAAIAPLRQIIEQQPHDFECRYELALAYRGMARLDEYEAEMTRVEASRNLVLEAAELNLQAIGEPANAEIRERLAEICDELGKPELAETWRRAAAMSRAMAR